MNAKALSIAICGVLGFSSVRADTAKVSDSESNDHKYRVEIVSPAKPEGMSAISVVTLANGESVGSVLFGGYASYPLNADPVNLAVSWSPSSKHLGLMVRNAKRSWHAVFFSVSQAGISSIELPSSTERALKLLGVREVFRVGRERSSKWIDEDSVVVRASGDASINGKVIWYEVDITYSITKRSITEAKLISTKPHEG